MGHREEPGLCLQGPGEPWKGLEQGRGWSLAVCGEWMGKDGTETGDQKGGREGRGEGEGRGEKVQGLC